MSGGFNMLTKLAKLSAIMLILFSCVGTTMAQKERGIYDPSLTRAEMIRNWEQFNDQYDKRWMVEWNKATGTPHRISGHYIKISEIPTKENISNISVRLLNTYQKLLQIEPDNLSLVSANFDKPRIQKPGYGTWYINYQQIYQGLPVYGGSVNLIIQNQKLTVICSDFYREIEVSTIPNISKEQAAEIANQGLSDVPILPII